jgi:hypothetical protein
MSEEPKEIQSPAEKILEAHPELCRAMRNSRVFAEIKSRNALEIDGEEFYIVKVDTLGSADDLFLDALAQGAKATAEDDLNRRLFLELDEAQKNALKERFEKP